MGTLLAERLRLETRDLHRAAERTGLMSELLQGRLDPAAYAALLRNLHALYVALETALQAHAHDPMVGRMVARAWFRAPALQADLDRLMPGAWQQGLLLAQAMAQYVQRLADLSAAHATQPRLLVAHAYVRYLGDLYGGQILKRAVLRHLGDKASTRFFEFGPEDELPALRQRFRQQMAAMQPTVQESDAIVAEARWAFVQHQRLFDELHAGVGSRG